MIVKLINDTFMIQTVRMNCRRSASSTARSREVFVHDGSMSWFLINRSVKSCKPDEPELRKHVQVGPIHHNDGLLQ